MDATQTQHLETFLLLALRATGEIGMQAESLLPRARLEALRELSVPDLARVLRDLADRGLVQSYGTGLGIQRWKITGLGRAALDEAGL